MNLTYKGICNDFAALPKGELPDNAVKFNEPDTANALTAAMVLVMIPVGAVIALFFGLSFLLHGGGRLDFSSFGFFGALAFHLASFLPHEFLHAACFGKAPTDFYISPKNMVLFVVSTSPISKRRFIWLSLCPNIFLGWIPLLVWVFVPVGGVAGTIIFAAAAMNVLSGAGDYMNVFNAARQMPTGSFHQHSGMNSFWFLP